MIKQILCFFSVVILTNKVSLYIRSCEVASLTTTVKLTTGMENLFLSPNPTIATDRVFIENLPSGREYKIKIFDISGKLMARTEGNSGQEGRIKLDIKNFPCGIYFAVVYYQNFYKILKFVVIK